MTTATRNGQHGTKKNPVTPTRDEIIAAVRALGGEPEVKRYEKVEGLEKAYGKTDVLHRWEIGDTLGISYKAHEEEAIRLYSVGLQRAPQTLRLSVRLASLYKLAQLRKMLADAATAGHELNWAHFRQLLREGLTEAQRTSLVERITAGRWGYRELEGVITAMLGGKKSKGGRKLGKMKYKTYAGALNAMKLRSQTWLTLEEEWLPQVKELLAKLSENEKLTPEFLTNTQSAVKQLRDVAYKAKCDADEAESIADDIRRAMGDPELHLEEETQKPAATNGYHKHAVGKVNGKAKPGKRVRLARHPRTVNAS